MIDDAALPGGLEAPAARSVERRGVRTTAACWSAEALAALAAHLAGPGLRAVAAVPLAERRAAWLDTVGDFLDPRSAARRALEPALVQLCGLSPEGVAAALEAVLGGVRGPAAEALFEQAAERRSPGLVAVFLASNLPALAAQPLLPALALGCPVLLKSPSAEPAFAPAFVRVLSAREPRLAPGLAAVTWEGGDEALEAPVLAAAARVVAYGEAGTLADIAERAPGKVVAYGPQASLAIVGSDVEPAAVAEALARDVALFDQRGCLSVQAVYTTLPAEILADALGAALQRAARRWPPGEADPGALAAVQQLRAEAELRGLHLIALEPAAGSVVVEPRPDFRPGPGLRSVRVHPVADLGEVPARLAPWRGRLQGAALAGEGAWALAPALEALGVSRCAPPGELQSPDALWHNGGRHPLDALAEPHGGQGA